MPKYNCCVPGCTNSHRNKPSGFKFYCIPKDADLRKKYDIILRNATLKIDSPSTRICADHWENGEKLSRSHLPSIFPWSKGKEERRKIVKASQEEIEKHSKKRKTSSDPEPVVCMEVTEPTETLQLQTVAEVSTQTDFQCVCLLKDENEKLKEKINLVEKQNKLFKSELQKLRSELNCLKSELTKEKHKQTIFDIEKYKSKDSDVEFYTGVPTYKMLTFCFSLVEESSNIYDESTEGNPQPETLKIGRPRSLTAFQEFVMTLIRLRLGLFEKDLSHRFGIAIGTVSNVTRKWIKLIRSQLGHLIRMPNRETIKYYSPPSFKQLFPNVVIVIDCTELEMEKPSALNIQSACYSSYKSRTTMKVLVGITPSGVLSFISELFPGSTSDQEIVKQSNFLNILSPGDSVMADKGFNIRDELASVGAILEGPSFLKKNTQFTEAEINNNKAIASLRIHVEREMERLKNWHILDRKIPITMAPYASDMVVAIAALSNFLPPLVS